ncbi:MAG: glycosyltransferase [Planctomycetes bacterium]|nr:glycosyltransferase [Planctomycetota bacterium]
MDALRPPPLKLVATADQAGAAARQAEGMVRCRWRVDGRFLARGAVKAVPRGVTYGPFPPNESGEPFPQPDQARADFRLMRQAGIDAIRTYVVPPEWLVALADEAGIGLLMDVPWSKHLCFLDSGRARREAREAVRRAAELGGRFSNVIGYSVGNEIPTDVVRWHGAGRICRFVGDLADVARQADPAGLVTYASFPPTEYLDLPGLDFITFNVYLHDAGAFRRYMLRLLNLVGDRPVVLGEVGMDSLRHGDSEQAAFLAGHLREAALLGLAGTFVFSWTDLWHTGGHLIEDWQFGITRADRTPKPAFEAVASVAAPEPASLLARHPRVSVVVCSYNGAATLGECLDSLGRLRYPDYEVILVDDGSTDETPAIAARFPAVRTIRQENKGLSESRNVGLRAATGEIVAYTDSDCYADPDWLTHLVHQLEATGADAVGGPNLSPDDGWLAACVGAAPGQPTHVLESDQVAEHIPGCNMAYRRGPLEQINGFDPQFLRAGDDVDVCWRLQQAGHWITFAPAAFVWHHRRQTPRAYLRQQSGYGEAEALLRFKHPEKFNGRGAWKWRGVLYGAALRGLKMGETLVYRGTFGTGLFQCLYTPPTSHWAMVPTTLEWHLAAALVAINAFAWRPAAVIAAAMLGVSMLVAILQAAQARLPQRLGGLRSWATVAVLCYLQPLVRSWAHYRGRLSRYASIESPPADGRTGWRWPWGRSTRSYWGETWGERPEVVKRTAAELRDNRWGVTLDTGWSDWDAEIFGHPWTCVRVTSVQEEHGEGKRLVRLRYRFGPTWLGWTVLAALVASVVLAAALEPGVALVLGGVVAMVVVWTAGRGGRLAARIRDAFERNATAIGLIPCDHRSERRRDG